jgi:hypothetical protein
MADAFGTLEFPAQPQGGDEAASDATLQKFGDFLSACITDKLGASWQSVAPSIPIIRTLGLYDPKVASFNNKDLPGLFVWRSRMQEERMADDWYVDHSEISILWVPDPIPQGQFTRRVPFLNGVAKTIYYAIVRGRDPAWIDPGDDDATAAAMGSVLTSRAGLIMQPILMHCEPVITSISADKETARYPSVLAKVDCHELSIWDGSLRGDSPPAHRTTLAIDGQPVGVIADPPTA